MNFPNVTDETCLAYKLRNSGYVLNSKEFKQCHTFEDTWDNPTLSIVIHPTSFDTGCNPHRHIDWAFNWAKWFPNKDAGKWLEIYTWETGYWLNWPVIIFFLFAPNGQLTGMTLYRMDAEPWDKIDNTWVVELGRDGQEVREPIPPWDREYSQEEFFDGLNFMMKHHGKSREEYAETQRRIAELKRQYRAERLRKEAK